MASPTPTHCRPVAFELFRAQLPVLETDEGLERAAIAIAMHEMESVDPTTVEARLDAMAARIRTRGPMSSQTARLSLLHDVLFDEEGFKGNTESYYLPENSYVPAVLANRLGIPISLALVYKAVARRVSVPVSGINAPGHFLALVDESDGGTMIVDPFRGGAVLTPDEAADFLSSMLGERMAYDPALLPRASHRVWVTRMLGNLEDVFENQHRADDRRAMTELKALLAGRSG